MDRDKFAHINTGNKFPEAWIMPFLQSYQTSLIPYPFDDYLVYTHDKDASHIIMITYFGRYLNINTIFTNLINCTIKEI
jgi:hypothetical protein